METVIFTLFNYGSDCREAYLLLQLFTTALRHEIKYSFHIRTRFVSSSMNIRRCCTVLI